MIKRMTFRQFLFILPLLVIVAVFSIYPILSSFVYTAFDYRLNDQQHNRLFLSSAFNNRIFHRNADHIVFFLDNEIFVAESAETTMAFIALQEYIQTFISPLEGQEDVRRISSTEYEALVGFISDVEERLNNIYEANPETPFFHREEMPILIEAMRDCFIDHNFIGLANYERLLRDSRFWRALRTTLIFTVISVAIELVLGMALALMMNKAIRGIGPLRTTALIPWAIPTAVAALMWSYLYDGSNGVVSHIFAAVGFIESPTSMLLTAQGALASAILADVWKTTPYIAILLLAGLQVIDRSLYESSSIDGADAIHTFRKITLPMLKSSILVALLFRTLDAFRVYDLIAVLTGGGPGGATETLSIYAHRLMIGQSNYGYGSTIVVAMFFCVAIIAFLFVKVMGAEVISNE